MASGFFKWKDPSNAEARVLVVVGLGVVIALSLTLLVSDVRRIYTQKTGDFEHFFYAADAMRHHADPYAAWTQGYIYPPLIAFVFQPLTLLTRSQAAGAMLVINVATTFIALYLAADEFLHCFDGPCSAPAIVFVIALSMLMNIDKVKGEWQMWQTDVFMLLLFVLGLRWQRRRPIAAGIALAIAINIKYLPLMFLPYLLIRRQWKICAAIVIGSVLFALLPALSSGWTENLHHWETATNGLLEMTAQTGPSFSSRAAEIHGVTDSLSCSITSALARASQHLGKPQLGFVMGGAVAMIALLTAGLIYRRSGISMFGTSKQTMSPPVIASEWIMLLAAILAFSPQTNTRHLFDALFLTSAASVLVIFAKPSVNRLPLLLGCMVLVAGFLLPPGSRIDGREQTATMTWLRLGGPCWCLLCAGMCVLWTGFAQARAMHYPGDEITRTDIAAV